MNGYTLVGDSIWVKHPVERLKGIDAIIFDIDGTLIDTRSSFRIAYRVALQLYFKLVLKADPPLWSDEDIQFLKLWAGLNGSEETINALVLLSLFAYRTGRPVPPEPLICPGRARSGLEYIHCHIEHHTAAADYHWISDHWQAPLCGQLLQECYAGPLGLRLYGRSPRYYQGAGLIEGETLLLDPHLIRWKRGRYGIVTARHTEEALYSLARLGIGLDARRIVTADMAPPKPDPRALAEVLRRVDDCVSPLYIGDHLDDVEMVTRWNNAGGAPKVLMAAVHPGLYGPSSRTYIYEKFLSAQVDVLTEDINAFLNWLKTFQVSAKGVSNSSQRSHSRSERR